MFIFDFKFFIIELYKILLLSLLCKDNLNLYCNSFTLSFWIKIPSTITAQHFIFGTFNNWPNNGIGIYRNTSNDKKYSFLIRSIDSSSYIQYPIPVNENLESGIWAHIAATYDGQNIKNYFNIFILYNKLYIYYL